MPVSVPAGGIFMYLPVIIGLAILWGVTAVVINPIVNAQYKQRMWQEGVDPEMEASMTQADARYWQGVYNKIYILWDVIILGVCGFLFGYFVGFGLIGISFSPIGWPGMLAFIGLSLL